MLRVYFSPDRASWAASNIVVVETTPIDGTFEVVESWKGDLSAGSQVIIPDLIPKANSLPISAYPKWWTPADRSGVAEQIPRQPVGSRLVLFLKRNKGVAGDMRKSEWLGWEPGADEESMKIAVIWIDGGGMYSFTQMWDTSEPLVLAAFGEHVLGERRFEPHSEDWLKQDVERVLRIQKEMTAVLAVKDSRARALGLKPYVASKIFPAQRQAMEELGKSGPSAIGTIGEILDDPAFAEHAPELVNAMVKAGGKTAGDELNRRLEQDLAFWIYMGPSLKQDWKGDPSHDSLLSYRYDQTYHLVYGLEQIGYPRALNTAIRLRDFSRSLPQFTNSDGRNQIADECNKLIAQLQTK
jgi:hypothetical protein